MSSSLRPVGPAHRAPLERLTRAAGLFREDEVAIAVELLDDYACWGPVPGTADTYDLYWLVVDPARQCSGVGTRLVEAVEHRLIGDGGRLVVVETSSLPAYAPTRAFYERRGYTRGATVPGYYAPGDDLMIYFKDLANGVLARAPA